MKKIIAMGLMSGTSVDAVDASLVLLGEKEDKLLFHHQMHFEPRLRSEILALIHNPTIAMPAFTRLHYEIGHAFAQAADQAIAAAHKKGALKRGALPCVIGSHGQTVFHDPDGRRTLQIGEASIIAARTGITTVADFRTADTAQGGEGAPLLPYYHQRLFAKERAKGLVVHNLGGISNYTYIGPKGALFALDTGPANCLLDAAMEIITEGKTRFDEGGRLAAQGKIHKPLLNAILAHPDVKAFRAKRAPKSSGRELFSTQLLKEALTQAGTPKTEDLLRTLAEITTQLILESYEREIRMRKLPLAKVVFAGGGTKNEFLLSLLGAGLKSCSFLTMEHFGWSSQALESQAFAAFAWLAIEGKPITFPKTTGARQPAVCGKISPGANWKKL